MADPVIRSTSWTGPVDKPVQPPTYGPGQSSTTSSYGQLTATQSAEPLSPPVRRWARLVGLVFLSPLLLLGSWRFAHAVTADELWADHRGWLILWGLALIGVFARELHAGRPVDAGPRSAFLALVLWSTLAFAIWYPYTVVTAHDGVVASQPERTYEIYHSCGRNCGYYVHQRRDGTTIEGTWVGDAVPYASICTLAQRLDGDRGFSWIRVLDRSPPPQHEVIWPIRREDCFSDKPLATIRN